MGSVEADWQQPLGNADVDRIVADIGLVRLSRVHSEHSSLRNSQVVPSQTRFMLANSPSRRWKYEAGHRRDYK